MPAACGVACPYRVRRGHSMVELTNPSSDLERVFRLS